MSVEDDNKALVRRFFDYINKDPFAPIDEFFAASYAYHNSSVPSVNDLSSLKEFNTAAYRAFPDIRFTLEDMVAERDKVVYECSPAGLTETSSWVSLRPASRFFSQPLLSHALPTANFRKIGKAWMESMYCSNSAQCP